MTVEASGTPRTTPSYLDWADEGRASGWRYLSGTVLILLIWFIGQAFLVIPGVLLLGGEFTTDGQLSIPVPWGELLVSLASFIPFFVATPLIVRYLHKRPALTVVTPYLRVDMRRIAWGGAAWGVTLLVLTVAGLALGGGQTIRWNFQPELFFPALLIALTILILQTTAEEMFFRGYLLQWFSKATGNIWVLAVASGLLFGLPHLANPEVAGASGAVGFLVALLIYFATGFALAVASLRSGTLELAIGAHFVNNFFNIVFLTAENSALGAPSLWVDSSSDINAAAVGSVLSAAIFIALTWRVRGSGDIRPRPVAPAPPAALSVLPLPGWFPDPLGQAPYRWWDGGSWTHHIG